MPTQRIQWAPRVPMEWLARLYELGAQGIEDADLVDKVGYRLYERCRDCIAVSDAAVGRRYAAFLDRLTSGPEHDRWAHFRAEVERAHR